MTLSRRSFLRTGAMTALLAGLAFDAVPRAYAQQLQPSDPSRDFAIPFEAQQSPVFYFKRETFEPYLNGPFKLRAGSRAIGATLVSVRDCTPSAKALRVTTKSRPSDCFALVFHAKGALTDLTTIYDVEHGALGTFALFLTRRDGPSGTYFYEAVFNHAR